MVDLLADEGVNYRIIKSLRESGIALVSVAEELSGSRDSEILKYCVQHDLLLLTEDGDFGELVFAHRQPRVGVLFVRYTKTEEKALTSSLLKVIQARSETLRGAFTVVTAKKVRSRPLP